MSMSSLGDNVVSDGALVLMFSQICKKNKAKQDDPSFTDRAHSHKFIQLLRNWTRQLQCD